MRKPRLAMSSRGKIEKPIMLIGFTGTQVGMSDHQKERLRALLYRLRIDGLTQEFHHGCCIGADEEAAQIAHDEGWIVVAHPPENEQKMSSHALVISMKILPPFSYLMRNKHIVNETTILIAAPKSRHEERRSGTWSTVRYARKQLRQIIFLERTDRYDKEKGSG